MARLTPCPSCHSHVLADDRECPHCGAILRPSGAPRVAAIAVGLTLAGCTPPVEPAYGLPDPTTEFTSTDGSSTGDATDTTSAQETGGSGSGSAGSDGTAGSGGTAGSDGTAGSGGTGTSGGDEPAYGVPTSG